jgi:putative tricarboxylic transport membrane protein
MLERIVPLVLLAAGAVYLTQAVALPFGGVARPGAGFYPVFVGAFAIVVALVATVTVFRAAATAPAAPAEPDAAERRKRVVVSVIALAGFSFFMPWLGYPIVAFVFTAVVLRYLGSRWITAMAIGALAAIVSHVLFAVLLDVPLPRGPW